MNVNKKVMIPAAVGIVSFGTGVVVGYFIHKKRNVAPTEHIVVKQEEKDPDEQLRLDFDKAAESRKTDSSIIMHNTNKEIRAEKERELRETKAMEEAVARERFESQPIAIIRVPEEVNMINVFTNEDSDWDYEVELARRNPEKPYTIHRDEFYEDNDIYDESTLMYYQGDDILVDSNDVPIYEKDTTTGELNFGHGSHDPSIVYIRNEPLKAQYEVILDHGYFAVEVLGADIEDDISASDLKHSLYKFRD